MRRREFIALVGGTAAATWPFAVHAQQPERLRRVGIVAGLSELEMRPLLAAFRDRLHALGWTEGSNVALDVRLSNADYTQMKVDAGKLIGLGVDVIFAQGTPAVVAIRQQSSTMPVVFILVADPENLGFIESLAHPGGVTTGFTNFQFSMGGKWLDLLRQIDPRVTHVTLVTNPANPNVVPFSKLIENAGRSFAMEITTASVTNPADIESAITKTGTRPGGGLIIFPDFLTTLNRDEIISLAARHRLPAVYPFRIFANAGGLMTYGLDFPKVYRDAADYVARILNGEKPGELPVQAPTQFELIINLKTAKALGLTVPLTLQASANEVIE